MDLQKTLRPLLMAAAIVVSGSVQAATNPATAEATSTGTTEISLTKADKLQISGLVDIPLVLAAGGGATGETPACIYRAGTPAYNLIASGNGTVARTGVGGGPGDDTDNPVTGNFFTLHQAGVAAVDAADAVDEVTDVNGDITTPASDAVLAADAIPGTSISYSVSFEPTGGTAVPLTTNTAVTGLVAHTELDCGTDRTNAKFLVSVSQADYIEAASGAYSGTLSLLVSPE